MRRLKQSAMDRILAAHALALAEQMVAEMRKLGPSQPGEHCNPECAQCARWSQLQRDIFIVTRTARHAAGKAVQAVTGSAADVAGHAPPDSPSPGTVAPGAAEGGAP